MPKRFVLLVSLILASPAVAHADLRLAVTGPLPATARAGDYVGVTLTLTNESSEVTRGDAIYTHGPSFAPAAGGGDGFFCSGRVDPRANTCVLMEDTGPGEKRIFRAGYTPFAGGVGVLEVSTGNQAIRITTEVTGPPFLERLQVSGTTFGAAPAIRYTATAAGRIAYTVIRRESGTTVARFDRPLGEGRGTFRWAGGQSLPRGRYVLRAVPRNVEGAGRKRATEFRVR